MSTEPTARPAVRPAPPWSFAEPTTTRLDNGLRVLAYDIPGQHIWSLRVTVPAPLAGEPRALEGVGTIMARTLDEGTRSHEPEELSELLERRGIALGASTGERGITVEMDVAGRRLGEALPLLTEALLYPVFPETQVRRHVRTRLAEIEQDLIHPGHRAAIAFADAFYPAEDRLSRPTGGTADTVGRISRDDVAEYHARIMRPEQSCVIVAGDLGGADVQASLQEHLGQWRGGSSSPVPAAAAPRPETSRIVVVDRPGSVQSELYVGCPGPDRTTPGGWAPYPVLGYLLGGSPQARLDAVLREEKGYTYGMRGGFRPRRNGGVFLASGSVRTEVTADALRLLLQILEDGRDGFTEDEVRAGVDFLCRTAPGRFATADAVADEAAARAAEGLTTAHTTQVLNDMRELTAATLQESYRRWIDGTWTCVVVGDAASLAGPLAQLNRCEITVLPA